LKLSLIIIFLSALESYSYPQQDTINNKRYVADSMITEVQKSDSILTIFENDPQKIDSLKLVVKDVVISGNDVTKDEIILREMSLKKNSEFTYSKYKHDKENIYNLRLFTKVDLIPIPVSGKEIVLNVDVNEKWYIMPLPHGGLDEGEWKKLWLGLNLRWENFRGRNETVSLFFRILYNPAVRFSYSVPWIGDKLHLYSSVNFGYEKTRNESLEALGITNGSSTIRYNDTNFDFYRFNSLLTAGKYIAEKLSLFTDIGYDYLRVSQYAEGRTVSPTGTDKYFTLGLGLKYDSRDIYDFATKGYFIRASFSRYGYYNNSINFGKFDLESQSFIPFNITPKYYITLASRVYTSQAVGAVIPLYHHVFLGYGDNYVRGWRDYAYEGEDIFTFYNELRIPILQPNYIKADKLPIVKDLPIIKKFELKHGLYFTMFYDLGGVWNKNDNLKNVRFRSGTGIGLNFILPFGYVVRADWAFRISRPVVGEIGLHLNAKF
jgi:outer membrane protein assembly factor BamA